MGFGEGRGAALTGLNWGAGVLFSQASETEY